MSPTTRFRKLIPPAILNTLYFSHKQGVPLTRLIRDHELCISSPHLSKLIYWYGELESKKSFNKDQLNIIAENLFPIWLTDRPTSPKVQQQPNTYTYKGKFPFGQWEEK